VGRERSAQNLTGTAWGGAWVAGGTQDREIGAVGGRQGRGIVDVGDLLLAGVGKKKPSKRNREERKPDGGGSARCRVGTGVGLGYGKSYSIFRVPNRPTIYI